MDKSLRRDLIWNLIGQFSFLFCLWLITVLTTNLISVEAQGILSLALVASNICVSFGNYYLRLQYASDIDNKFSDSTYVFARLFLVLVSVLICVVYGFALQYSLYVIGCIVVYYLYKAFDALSDIYHGVLQRQSKLYLGGITITFRGIVSVGAFALTAWLSGSLIWALAALVVCGALFFALDVFVTYKATGFLLKPKNFSFRSIWPLLKTCFPLFVLLLFTNILPSLPRIFFEKIYDEEQLGYYASVANIAVLLQMIAPIIMIPLVSKISRCYKDGDGKTFLKWNGAILSVFIVIGGLACLVVYWLGDWALRLVYGEKIAPYTYVFLLAIVAAFTTALVTVVTQILAAMEKRIYTAIILGIGTAVCAGISYPLCLNAYMDGISWSLIIAQGFTVILGYVLIVCFQKKHLTQLRNEAAASPESLPAEGNDIES